MQLWLGYQQFDLGYLVFRLLLSYWKIFLKSYTDIPWDYGVDSLQEVDRIEVAFQPLAMADIMVSVKVVHNESDKVPLKEEASQEPHPTFGTHPDTQVADFDLKRNRASSLQAQCGRHSFGQRTPGQIYQFDLY